MGRNLLLDLSTRFFLHKLSPSEAGSKLGTTHTEVTKKQISDTLTGRTLTETTRIKMSESHKGINHPMFGKIAANSMKIFLYSLDNTLVKEFSSQVLAAEWLGISSRTLRHYLNKKTFAGKYLIKSHKII